MPSHSNSLEIFSGGLGACAVGFLIVFISISPCAIPGRFTVRLATVDCLVVSGFPAACSAQLSFKIIEGWSCCLSFMDIPRRWCGDVVGSIYRRNPAGAALLDWHHQKMSSRLAVRHCLGRCSVFDRPESVLKGFTDCFSGLSSRFCHMGMEALHAHE